MEYDQGGLIPPMKLTKEVYSHPRSKTKELRPPQFHASH